MITISKAKFEEIRECVRDKVAFGHNMALQPLGHAEFIRECCESLVEEIEARGVDVEAGPGPSESIPYESAIKLARAANGWKIRAECAEAENKGLKDQFEQLQRELVDMRALLIVRSKQNSKLLNLLKRMRSGEITA